MSQVILDILTSSDVVIENLKGSITTWTKDASTLGHFNVANALVEVGCLVTFADLTTATIIVKTGDGTAASSVQLSADHATDSGLVSITALVFSAGNIQPNAVLAFEPDGANNPSTTYATATMTSNTAPSPNVTSACHEDKPAWKAWDRTSDNWLCNDNPHTNKWIQFDFGSGNTKIINKFRMQSAGDFPTTISLYGSTNGSSYSLLFTQSSLSDPGSGNWSDWFTFSNATAYGYYKWWPYRSDRTGNIAEIHAVEAGYTWRIPTLLHAFHTSDSSRLYSYGWSYISAAAITQTLAGSAVAYYAGSQTKGHDNETWAVFLGGVWSNIVKLVSGTWQYRSAAPATYTNATTNTRLGALRQAFGVATNQWAKSDIEAMDEADWMAGGGFDPTLDYIDWAGGLQASGSDLASFDKVTFTFNNEGVANPMGVTISRLKATLASWFSVKGGLTLKQVSTPGTTPASTTNYLYFKSDEKLYKKTSLGESVIEVDPGGDNGFLLTRVSNTVLKAAFKKSDGVVLWNPDEGRLERVRLATEPTLANTANDLDSNALVADNCYDVFYEYVSPTSFNIVVKKYTNNTTQAVVPAVWQGFLCYDNTTDNGKKRRYVGTIRLTTGPYFTMSQTQCFISNLYNAELVDCKKTLSGAGATTSSNTPAVYAAIASPHFEMVSCDASRNHVLIYWPNIYCTNEAAPANRGSVQLYQDGGAITGSDITNCYGQNAQGDGLSKVPMITKSVAVGYHYFDVYWWSMTNGKSVSGWDTIMSPKIWA